jgi:hypothetical protein
MLILVRMRDYYRERIINCSNRERKQIEILHELMNKSSIIPRKVTKKGPGRPKQKKGTVNGSQMKLDAFF